MHTLINDYIIHIHTLNLWINSMIVQTLLVLVLVALGLGAVDGKLVFKPVRGKSKSTVENGDKSITSIVLTKPLELPQREEGEEVVVRVRVSGSSSFITGVVTSVVEHPDESRRSVSGSLTDGGKFTISCGLLDRNDDDLFCVGFISPLSLLSEGNTQYQLMFDLDTGVHSIVEVDYSVSDDERILNGLVAQIPIKSIPLPLEVINNSGDAAKEKTIDLFSLARSMQDQVEASKYKYDSDRRRRLAEGDPTGQPSGEPSGQPTGEPSGIPSGEPSGQPTGEPTGEPTGQPTGVPSGEPSGQPTVG
jgi:hypothetical protein